MKSLLSVVIDPPVKLTPFVPTPYELNVSVVDFTLPPVINIPLRAFPCPAYTLNVFPVVLTAVVTNTEASYTVELVGW